MVATLAVVGVAIVAGAVYIGRTAGPAPAASPTPSPRSVAAGPTCAGLKFGSALVPLPDSAGKHTYDAPPPTVINATRHYLATVTMAQGGTVTLCLDPTLAPQTVNNFVFLARNKYFDGLTFHRVEEGFVIQGGDPQGAGTGGPGYFFRDEPVLSEYIQGCVAMAKSEANTNGSQFFICTADDTQKLQKLYNLFGYVQDGMDVVLKVKKGDVMKTVTVQEQQG